LRTLGVDLAWATTPGGKLNETGVVALEPSGVIVDAGWTAGVDETAEWMDRWAGAAGVLAFVDAPLIVDNDAGQRLCERQVGQHYGRWKVSANSTNRASKRLAGVELTETLEAKGWRYDDGRSGPPPTGRVVSECYPYTTLVGALEFGHPAERPRYKRPPKGMPAAAFRPLRAAACDGIIDSLKGLTNADPPLDLLSHPVTAELANERSPESDREYKHREDLIDAVISAWTAMLWRRHGRQRCLVLGIPDEPGPAPLATIIAPTRTSSAAETGT